jgi:hypothetical protein
MANTLDLVYTYQFVKRLATPFNKWKAYKLGIIDENGNVLRKSADLKTPEEVAAWGLFDRLVANIKKIIGKVPLGKTRLASYAAALLLLKESVHNLDELNDEELTALINEEIANVVGQGQVAGTGVGAQGEPPAKNKKSPKLLKNIIRRKIPYV